MASKGSAQSSTAGSIKHKSLKKASSKMPLFNMAVRLWSMSTKLSLFMKLPKITNRPSAATEDLPKFYLLANPSDYGAKIHFFFC